MMSEYRALVAKVDAFTEATSARRRDDLRCSAGCASCCHAWLTVSAVEAAAVRAALHQLPKITRAQIRARGQRERERQAKAEPTARCALLDADGCCTVYDARPLVCRTQGQALRYPTGFIPAELVTQRRADGDVTWCPLNYTQAQPSGSDVLDAERVDQLLALVARRYASAHDDDADTRIALSMLAAEKDTHDD